MGVILTTETSPGMILQVLPPKTKKLEANVMEVDGSDDVPFSNMVIFQVPKHALAVGALFRGDQT